MNTISLNTKLALKELQKQNPCPPGSLTGAVIPTSSKAMDAHRGQIICCEQRWTVCGATNDGCPGCCLWVGTGVALLCCLPSFLCIWFAPKWSSLGSWVCACVWWGGAKGRAGGSTRSKVMQRHRPAPGAIRALSGSVHDV